MRSRSSTATARSARPAASLVRDAAADEWSGEAAPISRRRRSCGRRRWPSRVGCARRRRCARAAHSSLRRRRLLGGAKAVARRQPLLAGRPVVARDAWCDRGRPPRRRRRRCSGGCCCARSASAATPRSASRGPSRRRARARALARDVRLLVALLAAGAATAEQEATAGTGGGCGSSPLRPRAPRPPPRAAGRCATSPSDRRPPTAAPPSLIGMRRSRRRAGSAAAGLRPPRPRRRWPRRHRRQGQFDPLRSHAALADAAPAARADAAGRTPRAVPAPRRAGRRVAALRHPLLRTATRGARGPTPTGCRRARRAARGGARG